MARTRTAKLYESEPWKNISPKIWEELVDGMQSTPMTSPGYADECGGAVPCEDANPRVGGRKTQWATNDDDIFYAVGRTSAKMDPAAYEIISHNGDFFFKKFPIISTGLINFPDTITGKVVDEAEKFWTEHAKFKRFQIPHRRGILVFGPAGCGKSSAVKLVCQDVINRGGVIIPFCNPPSVFVAGIALFRQIQPDTPIVVPMEDLDALLENTDESYVLNMLDGGFSYIDKVIWLATTNYPDKLERRITNRPSRFDCVLEMVQPCPEARRMALQHRLQFANAAEIAAFNLEKAVTDTEGLSFASVHELFTSVVVFGRAYDETLARIKEMADGDIPTGEDMEFGGRRGTMVLNGHQVGGTKRNRGRRGGF